MPAPSRLLAVSALLALAALFAGAPPAGAHFDVGGAHCKDVRFKRFPDVYATDVRAKDVACASARRLVRAVAFSESVAYDCRRKPHRGDDPHMDFLCTLGERQVSWAGYGG